MLLSLPGNLSLAPDLVPDLSDFIYNVTSSFPYGRLRYKLLSARFWNDLNTINNLALDSSFFGSIISQFYLQSWLLST